MRLGSTGDPFRWYISQPPNSGPSTFHSRRPPSAVRMNAPLRVPTSTRTPVTVPTPCGSLSDASDDRPRSDERATAKSSGPRRFEARRAHRNEPHRVGTVRDMTIAVGEKVPDIEVRTMGAEGPQAVRTGDVLGAGRVVLFA